MRVNCADSIPAGWGFIFLAVLGQIQWVRLRSMGTAASCVEKTPWTHTTMQQEKTSQFISLIVKRVDFIELGTNCLRLWFQEKSHKALGT